MLNPRLCISGCLVVSLFWFFSNIPIQKQIFQRAEASFLTCHLTSALNHTGRNPQSNEHELPISPQAEAFVHKKKCTEATGFNDCL